MRVYLPTSASTLRLLQTKAFVAGPFEAIGLTPGLRQWYSASDDDEFEYAAMSRATDLALALADQGRRIVVVLEAGDADIEVGDDPVGSLMLMQLESARVVSIHVDDAGAVPAVMMARAALTKVPAGVVPWEVEHLIDEDLAWFARQELDDVIAQLDVD